MKLNILTINKLVFCQLLFALLQVTPAFGMGWFSSISNWWNNAPRAQATAQLVRDVVINPGKVATDAYPYVKSAWQRMPKMQLIYPEQVRVPQGALPNIEPQGVRVPQVPDAPVQPVVQPQNLPAQPGVLDLPVVPAPALIQPHVAPVPLVVGHQAVQPVQAANPAQPSLIDRMYAVLPSAQQVKERVSALPGAAKEVGANIAHGAGYIAGSGVRGFIGGLVPTAIQNNATTAGTAVLNVVGSAPVQQAMQRVGSELVELANQPGSKGGATGMASHFAGAAAGEVAGRIVEKGIRPASAAIRDEIQRLDPVVKEYKEEFKSFKKEIGPFLKNVALIGAGVIVLGIATYYTTRFIANKMERHLNRPKLDFSLTKANAELTAEQHHALFSEMIFAQDVKDRLNTVLLTTAALKQRIQDGDDQSRYRNLLLYGPPGSGKRMFAHQLAQYANMDFIEVTGSALTRFKDGDAALAVEGFLKNEPTKSSKGAVIYVDNASMLFTKRKAGDASSLTRLVTAFMEQAERRSNKYMLVFGAPLRPSLASDIMAVIDDTIEINRPDENQRARLLQQQRDKLFTATDVSPELAHSVQVHLNDEGITNIAQRLRNASSADICKVLETLKVEAQLPSEGTITPALLGRIVDRAVTKYQELIA